MKIFFFLIPKLSDVFSGGSFLKRAWLLVQLYWFFFLTRILKKKTSLTLGLSYLGKEFNFELQNYLDFAVLQEVFIDEEYGWFPIKDPKYILDLGAHIGDTAIYYARHFPDSTIIAVEPDPENFLRLRHNCVSFENIIPINGAIAKEFGTVMLYKKSSGSLGSSTISNQEKDLAGVQVQKITIPELMQKYKIEVFDMIKFDIEGAEINMFPPNSSPESFSKTYIGEYHEDLTDTKVDVFVEKFKSNFSTETIALSKKGRYLLRLQWIF